MGEMGGGKGSGQRLRQRADVDTDGVFGAPTWKVQGVHGPRATNNRHAAPHGNWLQLSGAPVLRARGRGFCCAGSRQKSLSLLLLLSSRSLCRLGWWLALSLVYRDGSTARLPYRTAHGSAVQRCASGACTAVDLCSAAMSAGSNTSAHSGCGRNLRAVDEFQCASCS